MIARCLHIALLLLLLLAALSCQPHDPFCFHHPHGIVIVNYNWSEAPDAEDIGGTRVYFYGAEDGRQAAVTNFSGMKGGKLYLSEGRYNIVAYNNDTERLFWRGEKSISTLEAFTRDATLTEDMDAVRYDYIEGLVLTPDRLWGERYSELYVNRNDTTYVTLTPRKLTYEVIWQVTGIRGARRVSASAVTIAGVGGSLFMDDLHTERNESLMSDVGRRIGDGAKGNDDIGGFSGSFEVFGCNFTQECRHIFTIYCWSSGGNVKASYDVTDQFHIVHENRKIYINIDASFEIPAGGDESGGFQPNLDDWSVHNEDIRL